MKTLNYKILAILLIFGWTTGLFAQTEVYTGAQSSQARYLGKTTPLYDKQPVAPPNNNMKKQTKKENYPKAPENFKNTPPMGNNNPSPLPKGMDPLRQLSGFTSLVFPVEPIVNIEGIDVNEAQGIGVPDTNGDVSPEHYVQATNGGGTVFKVFDKEGNQIYGPASFNTLWGDFGLSGFGDPVVLYDQAADRWLFSEVASDFNTMLVAVSVTNDPMGSFYAYEFQSPLGLPDYPKFGIWPNAYYITTNEGGDANIPVYALDREAMLNGETNVSLQRLGIPKFPAANNFAFQVATAADWDGVYSPPPAGSPQYVVRMYDDAWDGGVDKLEVWEIAVDWGNANNSTVTGPIELPTTPFDADLCGGDIFNCLAQSNGSLISALQQVLMHRVNYRNFGTHESMVLNFTVDVDGNNFGGVRWYELRKPFGGQWEIYQEGTQSPDDNHRFMGSIAMDAAGNIGLGYSVMGPDKHLSLVFTGRKVDDPLGQMTVDEYEFATGLSFHLGNRWGDYSMMTVDESDGRTFWFTSEYMKNNASWGTKIVSFIINRDTIDVGPTGLVTPENSAYLTDSETVQISIKNFGLEPQTNFEIGYIFEENPAVTETVLVTLEPDSVYVHTFTPTVDMSVIGDYNFQIFTALADDGNIINDTLRRVVSKTTRFDAAITQFLGIDGTICDSIINAGVVLTNAGAEKLTTADLTWDLNSSVTDTYSWSGSLLNGESDTIYFDLQPLVAGTNTFTVFSENPNGVADEDMTNDTLSRTIEVVIGGGFVKLELLTDLFPNETSWELMDESGTVLFSNGPYLLGETVYEENWCLADGCYTFTIFDTFGDGIQAYGVEGNYTISDENGVVLASLMVPNFGTSESNEFCFPFVCALEAEALTMNESGAGANDGAINILPSNGAAPFQYSIDGGINFQNDPFFGDLPGGTYSVVVTDANQCSFEIEVEVGTCTLDFSVIVEDVTSGNLDDGSITIQVNTGNPPYSYSIDGGNNFQDENIFNNLTPGDYEVVVRDELGCLSNLMVTVDVMVSVGNTLFGKSIKIFPNPTEGVFLIEIEGLKELQTLEVEIIDETGKIVQRGRLVNYNGVLSGQMSLYAYASGIYFIRFKHEEFNHLIKIVRN
jgi:Secretion system C-terminal sorting domain/SprB repeat